MRPFVTPAIASLERHQVAWYLGAIVVGLAGGLLLPAAARLDVAITPVLGLLLFATFLGVPFGSVLRSFGDGRFLGAVLIVNFVVVPAVAFGLSRFVAGDPALVFGVLLVLLTPCVDYVIVFSGLAGGASARLLAAAPLLMLVQILLLPVLLRVILGAEAVAAVDIGPFAEAFLLLIVVPLVAAAALQALAARSAAGRRVERAVQAAMVPLMVATLLTVVASQAGAVGAALPRLGAVALVFAAFVVVMTVIGGTAGRVARLDTPGRRALLFSGVTRNSLVVLPLALALPPALSLVPVVVVTQTLVELVAMVLLVRLVPRLVP
ncbi:MULTISPECIES: arsenic resistance protein [unclassified Rathayibacter]|uniref:arsenic resistance protein n=1 Tax=unclassified Rathayibacter TaxID=2609250 RepID=UPI000700FE53|nr:MULTISPECIES: bile acid:sodium symporter [unclassified Rathayibacter]KQQ06159.1 arsenic resistance protein [Rathayibacter sp. Leaf294]KQS14016.1 arsenic resistance protein [Rathayibacter sp. Leaf185]